MAGPTFISDLGHGYDLVCLRVYSEHSVGEIRANSAAVRGRFYRSHRLVVALRTFFIDNDGVVTYFTANQRRGLCWRDSWT